MRYEVRKDYWWERYGEGGRTPTPNQKHHHYEWGLELLVPLVGLKPTYFQLRYARLEDEADTEAQMKCENCNLEFQPKWVGQRFHSRSCANGFNRKGKPSCNALKLVGVPGFKPG